MIKHLIRFLLSSGKLDTPSLHRQLLSLSLLTVLAGYSVLLFVHAIISSDTRRIRHQQTVERIRQELLTLHTQPGSSRSIKENLNRLLTPGMVVRILDRPEPSSSSPGLGFESLLRLLERTDMSQGGKTILREYRVGSTTYVSSSLSFPVDGEAIQLHFLSDVSEDIAQEHSVLILLLASALMTVLITGLLLRPAIRSGLGPLQDLRTRLESIETESLSQQQIPIAGQPAELLPIIESFNGLLRRLDQSWERQRSFVNSVSHELRTPITIISGYARRLTRSVHNLTEKQRTQIDMIEAEAQRMGLLVNDLLDLARSDAGRLEISRSSVDPVACLMHVMARMQDHANGRLAIDPLVDESHLPQASGDPARIEQCLANLVENALKYSPADCLVQLSCTWQGNAEVMLHVIDRGPGVPDEEKERIFDRFRRGSQSTSVVGSGIGLAVVRTLMQAMGGHVDVVDAEGGGADFRLHLPLLTTIEIT